MSKFLIKFLIGSFLLGVALLLGGPPLVLLIPILWMLGSLFLGIIAISIALAYLVTGTSKATWSAYRLVRPRRR